LSVWHNPLLVNPITTGLGKPSDSLYLTHFIFAWYIRQNHDQPAEKACKAVTAESTVDL
jgi:hypothetical protein